MQIGRTNNFPHHNQYVRMRIYVQYSIPEYGIGKKATTLCSYSPDHIKIHFLQGNNSLFMYKYG